MNYTETAGLDLFMEPFCSPQSSVAFTASGRESAQTARPQQAQAPAAQSKAPVSPASRPDTAASTGHESWPEIPEKPSSDKKGSDPAQSQLQTGQPKNPEPTSEREVQAETLDFEKKQPSADAQTQPESPKKELIADSIPAGKPLAASDEIKRKAHEEAEAKRKAEWEAKQREKKEKEEAALKDIQTMSDADAVAACFAVFL